MEEALVKGVVGRDASVGPNLEDQLVEVGDLADAGRLYGVLDEPDRREERIDRDDADRPAPPSCSARQDSSRGRS